MRRLRHRCRCLLYFRLWCAGRLSCREFDSDSGLRGRGYIGFLLRSARACRSRRSWGFIFLHEVLGENTLLLVPRVVGILTKVPFRVFLCRNGYDLADRKVEVVIVARSVFEDRFDCEWRTGHLASRGLTEDVGGGGRNWRTERKRG